MFCEFSALIEEALGIIAGNELGSPGLLHLRTPASPSPPQHHHQPIWTASQLADLAASHGLEVPTLSGLDYLIFPGWAESLERPKLLLSFVCPSQLRSRGSPFLNQDPNDFFGWAGLFESYAFVLGIHCTSGGSALKRTCTKWQGENRIIHIDDEIQISGGFQLSLKSFLLGCWESEV